MSTVQAGPLKSHRLILLILLFAASLYLYQLGENSLWLDEFSSIYDAQNLPGSLNPTRPIYYILLRFWMVFGTNAVWLRGFSVIFGLGGVFLIYVLGRRIAGSPIGHIAAVLLACSPLFINHVQEVRMYTLGNFLSLLGAILLIDALEKPTVASIGKWAVSRLLATLTTPLSILLLLPDALIVVWKFRRQGRILWKFGLGAAFIGALLLPSAVAIITQTGPAFMSDWTAELAKPGLAAIVSKLTSFTAFWPLASLPKSFLIRGFYYAYTLALAGLLTIALLRVKKQPGLFWVAAWALLPAAVVLLISHILSPIWNGRYLLFLSPYVLILLAVGFAKVWRWHRQITVAIALAYMLALGGGLWQYYANWHRDAWQAAVDVVSAEEIGGDAIAVYAPIKDPRIAIAYYYEGDAPIHPIGPFKGSISQQEVARVLEELPTFSKRLWLIYRGINGHPKVNKLVEQEIEARFNVQSHQKFDGPIDLFLAIPK